ncbi:putative signal transducing protein [Thiolapillus sp.]
MIPVFHALNTIEAHTIKIHLIGNGIEARVAGDYLQGAIGELPAVGMVRVLVAEADEVRAKKLIQELHNNVDEDDSWIPSGLR